METENKKRKNWEVEEIYGDADINTFTFAAYFNLDRNYGPAMGSREYNVVNDWFIYSLEE